MCLSESVVLIQNQHFVNKNSWKEAVSAKTKWIQYQWCVEWGLERFWSRGYLEFTFAALWSQSEIRWLSPIKLFFMPWLHQLAYLASHIGNVTHKIQNLNQLGQLLIFFLLQLPTQKLPALWKLASWKKAGTSVLSLASLCFTTKVCAVFISRVLSSDSGRLERGMAVTCIALETSGDFLAKDSWRGS